MFVLGTAGHVDHGKSALVQALTGIDPDRLEEEKRRGLTIDLGFAWLKLPSGREVSLVDVPGHERFIKNMLAGAGGIDLALLIVAADESVMPQTREHLAILDLLGISSGIVVVTKADLADPDLLGLVAEEAAELLEGTALAGSPVVHTSARTGQGLDELKLLIDERLDEAAPRKDAGRPRLPIDRVFTVAGFGTVVTGTLIDGALRLGEELEVQPGGLRTRVRGLQIHRSKAEEAPPGTRVAVNLVGLGVSDLRRGMVLARPGWLRPVTSFDARVRAVRELSHPFRHNTEVSVHSGAAEVQGRLRLLDREELRAGEEAWAQVVMREPMALLRGDRFVARTPNETVCGGVVLELQVKRHRRNDKAVLERLRRRLEDDLPAALEAYLDEAGPTTPAAVGQALQLPEAALREALAGLESDGRIARVGDGLVASVGGLRRLERALGTEMRDYFFRNPLRLGMPKEQLRSRLKLQSSVFEAFLAYEGQAGRLDVRGSDAAPAGRQVSLLPEQERQATAFLEGLRKDRFSPATDSRPDPALAAYLEDTGQVEALGDGVWYAREAYEEAVALIREAIEREGPITLARVRDLLGTSRKYAQALLEHLDQKRITRRVGDERVLR